MVLRRRHLAKAITYRIGGAVFTGVMAYCLTKDLHVSLMLAPIDSAVKTAFYYAHERLWHKFKWGVRDS